MACIDQDFLDDLFYVPEYFHTFRYTTDIKVLPFRFITGNREDMIGLSDCYRYSTELRPCYTWKKWLCYDSNEKHIVVNQIYDIKHNSKCHEEIRNIFRGKYKWDTLQPEKNANKSFRDDNKPQAVLVGADNEENTLTKLYRQTLNKKTEEQIHHCQTDNACRKLRKYLREYIDKHITGRVGGPTG